MPPIAQQIDVQESSEQLELIIDNLSGNRSAKYRIRLLRLIKNDPQITNRAAARRLSVSECSIRTWKKIYESYGIEPLINMNTGRPNGAVILNTSNPRRTKLMRKLNRLRSQLMLLEEQLATI